MVALYSKVLRLSHRQLPELVTTIPPHTNQSSEGESFGSQPTFSCEINIDIIHGFTSHDITPLTPSQANNNNNNQDGCLVLNDEGSLS